MEREMECRAFRAEEWCLMGSTGDCGCQTRILKALDEVKYFLNFYQCASIGH
jgi:hypothetical protein